MSNHKYNPDYGYSMEEWEELSEEQKRAIETDYWDWAEYQDWLNAGL